MICSNCKRDLSDTEFHFRDKVRGVRRAECKMCVRAYKKRYGDRNAADLKIRRAAQHVKHRAANVERMRVWRFKNRYGITPAQYDVWFAHQGGACALCGSPPGSKALCVDHDHETGRVRGLLCLQCNSALGKLGDSVASLKRALAYVQGEPFLDDLLTPL